LSNAAIDVHGTVPYLRLASSAVDSLFHESLLKRFKIKMADAWTFLLLGIA
jgi:hypothetical protein